jgi:hypothetical protein
MRGSSRAVLAIFTTLVAAGCGSPSLQALNDFYDKYAAADCQWQRDCGYIAVSEIPDCTTRRVATLHRDGFGPTRYSVDNAITAGLLEIDPDGAQACLDAFKISTCDSRGPSVCAFVRGLVPVGGTCRPGECANGHCGPIAERCGTSTCRAYLSLGAPCVNVDDCDPKTGSCSTLGSKTCVPWVGPNGQCLDHVLDCARGLYCSGSSSGPMVMMGTCQPPGGEGAPCGTCQDGLTCVSNGGTSTCTPLVAEGGACSATLPCARGLGCALAATPFAPAKCSGWLAIGEGCDPNAVTTCPHDAPCDWTAHNCLAPPSLLNVPCNAYVTCTNTVRNEPVPLYCDAMTKVCTATLAPGAACVPPPPGSESWQDPCGVSTPCDPITHTCPASCM